MSLRYNVVIIDDQELLFSEYKGIIDQFLEKSGFVADVDYVSSAEAFSSYPLDKPDLFLVDLKFGQENKGQLFIKSIRDNNLTDVLFYSSDHDAIEKYRLDIGSQGIFFAERDEQNDEVEELLIRLLRKMIAKANTPRTTRGLVMECVAEIDDQVKEKTLLLYRNISTEQRDVFLSRIVKRIKQSNDGRIRKLNEFFGVDFAKKIEGTLTVGNDYVLEDLIENIHVTDSSKNLSFLLILYKMVKGEDKVYHTVSEYADLLEKRNILAHVSQTKDGDKYIFKARSSTGNDYVLSDEECLKLRQAILLLSKTIRDISN